MFGSDFFPLGLADGLSSSGFLWRRASLRRVSLGLSCLGFAGFAGFCGSQFFMVSAGSAWRFTSLGFFWVGLDGALQGVQG